MTGKGVKLNVKLDEELHAEAKSVAALTGRHLYELVQDGIRHEVEVFRARQRRDDRRRDR